MRVLYAFFLAVLLAAPCYGQHYCTCVGQDNTIGATFDANWRDSIFLDMLPTPQFGDGTWAWFDIGADYPAINVVGVWGNQDSGVQMTVMSSPDKHNNWPLVAMGHNRDTGYWCRYYTFKLQPGYQQRFIAITRPLNDTAGYLGIDCVQVWSDESVATETTGRALRANPQSGDEWMDVAGRQTSLSSAHSGVYFNARTHERKVVIR